ncbi:ATP-grasp domain-containing protein [Streptomyces microflavus]|uniref:ATP-grasp domain-containing protein n=1 Tax=Streptomyces microflavus TaxID=1919 RepID=UPI00380C9B1F
MTDHVLVFGLGFDIPGRMRAAGATSGEGVTTSLMCLPKHLTKTDDIDKHSRVFVLGPEAPVEEWITVAAAIHSVEPVTLIGSFYDDCRHQAMAVAQSLGLHTYDAGTVELTENKAAMRERLAEAGVERTAHALVDSADAVRAFADEHGYPCVVKPLVGGASKGVSILGAPGDAEAAVAHAGGAMGPKPSQITVEEFLTGHQYSVEGFSEQGEHVVVSITRKYSDPASLVELGHVMPASLAPGDAKAITRHVIATLDALGVEFGPTHTEVILTERGPRIIETHLRTGGDELWNLVSDSTGVDLIESQLRQVLGEKVLPGVRAALADPDRPTHCEAIWFAGAPASGTLTEVAGADTVLPEGVTLEILGEAGTELYGLRDSFSRLARARASAPTAQEAVALAREAINGLTFLVSHAAAQDELL